MSTGSLYIVATPIGNLKDITYRAVDVLKQVDIIAAEDTRHSRKLLDHYGIATKMMAVHDHNEADKITALLDVLNQGQSIALISDAGTPLISDPGYRLVRGVREQGGSVVAIPGPCAAIAALSIAGLPTDRFLFVGFLSAKQQARRAQLEQFVNERATLVLYESPKRILDCIADAELVLGEDRTMALVKEITKTFETVRTGTGRQLRDWLLESDAHRKGEFVVLIEGVQDAGRVPSIDPSVLRALNLAHQSMPLKKACALVSELSGVAKNALYEAAIANSNE
ncbi:16S rRNA (cytidine(1402)-2'-O)-methyltransferase [Ketobacter sp. MCCC 1A13808]|uniref:16S rRNA (cytidine(1402)-2'-O)-methyltransferase n=1 Tax=Ketobacter sp. MCCC 1A13808 TaxID=2602738 RepID=UPI0012EB2913|nr:16S rRNA (cytidine(1402)-2'-O)-methyltransferase [Ketobacter sp. MCCC 1A13808]MVF11214.1 16S rRNA (cytidine(1402)-2'-O)-methyltransferase [Ketobacter sp. MCCC 1A13808]